MRNIALIDLETTGLSPARHEIIELACLILDPETLDVVTSYNTKIMPLAPEAGDAEAYAVNGYSEVAWIGALPLSEAITTLADMTKDCTLMSYNVSFDYGFLHEAFRKTSIEDTMDYHRLDLFTLAWSKLPHDIVTSWRLKKVAEHLGVLPEPEIHSAFGGVWCAYKVLKELQSCI